MVVVVVVVVVAAATVAAVSMVVLVRMSLMSDDDDDHDDHLVVQWCSGTVAVQHSALTMQWGNGALVLVYWLHCMVTW